MSTLMIVAVVGTPNVKPSHMHKPAMAVPTIDLDVAMKKYAIASEDRMKIKL